MAQVVIAAPYWLLPLLPPQTFDAGEDAAGDAASTVDTAAVEFADVMMRRWRRWRSPIVGSRVSSAKTTWEITARWW